MNSVVRARTASAAARINSRARARLLSTVEIFTSGHCIRNYLYQREVSTACDSGRVSWLSHTRPLSQAVLTSCPLFITKPLDEAVYAVFDLCLRVVAEQSACLRYIGVGLRHVARLCGLAINDGLLAQFFFQQRDQLT